MTEIMTVEADITTLGTDAIVNAANVRLHHSGGVAAAISHAGGPAIQAASDAWVERHGPLSPGVAAVTTAGRMPSRMVIHVAGPVHHEGEDNAGLLRTAVRAALDTCRDQGCRSIALPAISSGIYGYPVTEATRIIADECRVWSAANANALDEILLVGYDAAVTTAFEAALQ